MYEIVTIPFNSVTKTFNVDDLNAFCINKKVISTKIKFFQDEKHTYWAIFIEYETVLEKNSNEPSGLAEAGKLCYEKLRQWRKETAEKEGVPPYVIAKNSQLGIIVKKEIKTLAALKQLNGFGVKKIEKYGKDICGIVKAFYSDISADISDER